MSFIHQAKKHFGQAILVGANSIRDPDFKGQPLPLWSLDFWEKAHHIIDLQNAWRKAQKWLEKCLSKGIDVTESQAYLTVMNWNSIVYVLGERITLSALTSIISDSMICGSVLNAMCKITASLKDTSNTYEIVTLEFFDMVLKAKANGFEERSEMNKKSSNTTVLYQKFWRRNARTCFSYLRWKFFLFWQLSAGFAPPLRGRAEIRRD